MSLYRRLHSEMECFIRDPPDNCSVKYASDGNPSHWIVTIIGFTETPYEGGYFYFDVLFPEDYPIHPPQITAKTPIFHCNIYENGDICLDTLGWNWESTMNFNMVIITICNLLNIQNPNLPANRDAALLIRSKGMSEFNAQARIFTRQHAIRRFDL